MDHGLLHDGLAYWARRNPEKIAVSIDNDDSISYADLARWSDAVAGYLQGQGVFPQDNVSVAAGNSIAWVAVAFGVLKAGAVICPLNDRLVGPELAYLADLCQPRLIIADGVRLRLMREAGVEERLIDIADLASLRRQPAPGFRPSRVATDALAMILFTSGSTASPKGVMMTHAAYLAKFLEMKMLDGTLGSETRSLMPLGLHATPGTAWGILFTTTIGGTLHIKRRYDAESALATLVEAEINYFIGVPMIYDEISRLAAFADANLSGLSFARVGGASASPELFDRWRAKGVVIRQLYGMTEVGGAALIATIEEALAKPDSCGRGLAYTAVRIVRDDGSDCLADEAGDVIIQGAGVMTGYWRDPEGTASALRGGWMHTGDIARWDADGYFHFVDRSKEMIKSGGYNVSPAEIEGILMAIDGMVEAVVVGVPDERYGESACACVYMNRKASADEILEHCTRHLAGYKLPRFIIQSEGQLPRLANEKFDRRRMRAEQSQVSLRMQRLSSKSGSAH